MLQLYDIKHNKIELLTQCKDAYIENEISDGLLDKNLSFSYPLTDSKSQLIKFDGFIRTKDDEFVIKEISFSDNSKEVKCKLNVEELEEKKHSSFNFSGNINKILDTLLNGIVWTYEIKQVPSITNAVFQVDSETTAFDLCKSITEQFEVEFKFDTINKKILVYNKIGVDSGQIITSDIQVQGDTYDLITEINATGANGITCKVTNHSYSPRIKSLNWTDERYTSTETLRNAAQTKLDKLCKPLFSYSCSTLRCKSISVGDYVNILDKKSGTKVKERAVKTKEYIRESEKYKNEFEIDNAKPTFQDYLNSKFNSYDSKFNSYDSKYNSKFNNYDNKINNLDNRVTNLEKGSGGATLDESIYIIDTSRSTGVKEISFNIPFTDSKSYETNWGDGIVNKEKSHTYTTDGEYTIKTQVPYSIDTSTTFVRKSLIEIVKLAENITDCRWGTSKDMGGFQYCTGLKKVGDILGIKNGFYMFSGCTNLKHPANIRDLENAEGMYSDCTNLLDTGNIPNNLKVCLYMFSGCTKLKYINNLNSIANAIGMFENCTSIESLPSLPQTLISSSNMFSCCTMLNYEGTLKIPGNLKGAKYMFDRCTGLKCSVDFSDNAVLEDAEAMFTGCNNIKSFNQIPMSISNIKSMFSGCWNATFTITKLPETTNFSCTFQNCYKLTKAIAIPETAKTVNNMYSGCKLLSSAVKIPNNVTSCVSIYSYCNKLSEVQEDVLPNNNLGVDATRAFAYSGITTAINIYNNTKAVEMFYGCNDLKTMANILDGVTTANGLYNSSGITNPNEKKLPDSLQWIDKMFANTSIEETINYIPASCSSVREMFFKCSKLTKITTEFLTFMANATLSKYNRQGTFFGCYAITDPDTYSNMKNGEYADWFNI